MHAGSCLLRSTQKKIEDFFSSFSFKFEIALHADDVEMLNYVQENLGIGRVSVQGKKAPFFV